ncbi:hypothetical protein Ccrd_004794, partial [Cynara cardunculus var. scolymus]
PCQNPIEVVAEGATLLAPTDPKAIKTESWFHIKNVNKMTLTGVIEKAIIDAPAESLNTDGIHIGRTNGFKIVGTIEVFESNCAYYHLVLTGTTIKTGDDCISIGDGSKNIHVEKTTCGPGHGFSIGSLGRYPGEEPVDGIFFLGCSISNSDNGLRIKTWPGSLPGVANQLHFEDIIMENISDVLFKGIRGTSMTKYAITILCSKELQCDKVVLQDIDLKYEGKEGPGAVSGCHNVKPQVIGNVVPQP